MLRSAPPGILLITLVSGTNLKNMDMLSAFIRLLSYFHAALRDTQADPIIRCRVGFPAMLIRAARHPRLMFCCLLPFAGQSDPFVEFSNGRCAALPCLRCCQRCFRVLSPRALAVSVGRQTVHSKTITDSNNPDFKNVRSTQLFGCVFRF